MKHNVKITVILLAMFIVTQLIGLAVVQFYLNDAIKIPYGFDNKEEIAQGGDNIYYSFLGSFFVSLVIAIVIIFFLMRIKSAWFIRIWFFIVIAFALGITINSLMLRANIGYAEVIALGIGVLLAFLKVFRKSLIVHNITELLIYPGIAAIFVLMFNIWTTIILLVLISIYDIWAVWHSGVMQKMARYQINEVGVFSGFFIPYANKKIKDKIKLLKLKYKNNIPQKVIKKNNLKINLAILGGGDVVFPIIAAGVFMKTFNIAAALSVVFFATLALLYLFVFAKKKKFYPAMPYLTTGIFLGMLVGWLLFVRLGLLG